MAHKMFRALLAAVLTALAANCFLKYLWWTASYSAWSSIPKMADQSKLASSNASFNGWGFLALEIAAFVALYTLISWRNSTPSGFLKPGMRVALSLIITIAATVVFAFVLSWLKQGGL